MSHKGRSPLYSEILDKGITTLTELRAIHPELDKFRALGLLGRIKQYHNSNNKPIPSEPTKAAPVPINQEPAIITVSSERIQEEIKRLVSESLTSETSQREAYDLANELIKHFEDRRKLLLNLEEKERELRKSVSDFVFSLFRRGYFQEKNGGLRCSKQP